MSGTDLVDSKAIFKARPYSKQGHTQSKAILKRMKGKVLRPSRHKNYKVKIESMQKSLVKFV